MPAGIRMIRDTRTAREIFEGIIADPDRPRFGFGKKAAVVNIDFQNAYTRIDQFSTAYETDPLQIEYTNQISHLAREGGMPVIWTQVAYMGTGADAGIWAKRTVTTDSLENMKLGSHRHDFDSRCDINPAVDAIFDKRMPSAFFETPLGSFLTWKGVDTVVVTGSSTSGCVRATAVDALSRGFQTIVPIETCADRHESFHYASLTDLQLKYADVLPVSEVISWFESR